MLEVPMTNKFTDRAIDSTILSPMNVNPNSHSWTNLEAPGHEAPSGLLRYL
jgi:hypothetical protein